MPAGAPASPLLAAAIPQYSSEPMNETPHPRGTDGLADSANRSLRTLAAAVLKVSPTDVVEAERPEDIDDLAARPFLRRT